METITIIFNNKKRLRKRIHSTLRKNVYMIILHSIQFENIYSFTPDGLLHQEGSPYDTNGKLISKWFFMLKRNHDSAGK